MTSPLDDTAEAEEEERIRDTVQRIEKLFTLPFHLEPQDYAACSIGHVRPLQGRIAHERPAG